MMKDQGKLSEFEQELNRKLLSLKPDLPRDAGAEARGRKRFLAEAREYRVHYQRAAVRSTNPLSRFFQRLTVKRNRPVRRQQSPIFSAALAILICVILVVEGTNTVIYAAEDSLPNETLYTLKTWGEGLRLQFTQDEEAQIELLLKYNMRRVGEVTTLVQSGLDVPETSVEIIEQQTNQALEIATTLDDEQMVIVLDLISDQLSDQERFMDQSQTNNPESTNPVIDKIRETLRNQVQLAELGKESPVELKEQLKKNADHKGGNLPGGKDSRGNDNSPKPSNGSQGDGLEDPQPDSESGTGLDSNKDAGGTPTVGPGSSANPGPTTGPGS